MTKSDQVAYKPLNMAPDNTDEDDENEDNDIELDHELVVSSFERPSSSLSSDIYSKSRQFINLRQLRCLLYVIAGILLLIFIARLSTHNELNRANSSPPLNLSQAAKIVGTHDTNDNVDGAAQHHSGSGQVTSAGSAMLPSTKQHNNIPGYDNYMLSILNERQQQSSVQASSDDLQYEQPQNVHNNGHQNTRKIWWTTGSRLSDRYVTITNYIRAMKSFNFNASITLTTQATSEFMYHTLELCKRWDGPISVAVYCPGPEMQVAVSLIKFMRQCLPAPLSSCIRDKVTWHLAYDRVHGPRSTEIGYPKSRLDSVNYPLFVNAEQCPKLAGPETVDLIQQFQSQLMQMNKISPPNNYRKQFKLNYPINVLRNTARLAATTRHILSSDIELYPSVNLVPNFIKFISNHDLSREYPHVKRYVFTLPLFEVKSNVSTAPRTKPELIRLMESGDAIFFHKWVCDACQNFPHRQDWLERDTLDYKPNNHHVDSDEIVVFDIAQRDSSRSSWEPIFIGTNDEPLYDDRLTWDGRRDKMGQMYEMCLQDYYLIILGNAFLTHAPGIKHFDREDFTRRTPLIRNNNAIYDGTITKLRQQYANSANINKC